MRLEEILSRAAVLLGEDLRIMCEEGEARMSTLSDRLRLGVEMHAAEAVMATPRDRLSGWLPLPSDNMKEEDDGSVILPLPENFLLLGSVRLAGWRRSVTEITPPGSGAALKTGSPWEGVRGSSIRPVAVEGISATGGRCLHLYGRHEAPAALAEGWWLPIPKVGTDGEIPLPEASLPLLLRLMTGD